MSIKIKAVAFKDIKQVELVERETPDLRPDEVLVKVHAVALCSIYALQPSGYGNKEECCHLQSAQYHHPRGSGLYGGI